MNPDLVRPPGGPSAPTEAAPPSTPSTAARVAAAPPCIDSTALFGPAVEIQIDHHGTLYRLRKTALGKLILTK